MGRDTRYKISRVTRGRHDSEPSPMHKQVMHLGLESKVPTPSLAVAKVLYQASGASTGILAEAVPLLRNNHDSTDYSMHGNQPSNAARNPCDTRRDLREGS
jgi:hypothetical protein